MHRRRIRLLSRAQVAAPGAEQDQRRKGALARLPAGRTGGNSAEPEAEAVDGPNAGAAR